MPKSLGGTAQVRAVDPASLVNITPTASHSDPSIPLVSIFSPHIWDATRDNNSSALFDQQQQQQQQPPHPRPRPSLQVYYTAPDAGDPAYLASAARVLETAVLAPRHEGRDPAECDRLDVYGMPGTGLAACVAHQAREIAARVADRDWYIQRYDVGGGAWRRALVVVRRAQEEWVRGDGNRQEIGLSVVFFDKVDPEIGGGEWWELSADNVEQEQVLTRELKAELNWQHSASQFED